MREALRRALFSAAFAGTAALGADRWLRPLAQGRGVILTFHHVRPRRPGAFAPNRLLEITPDFLDEVLTALAQLGFAVVPLDEVPDRLGRPGRFAVLTFDDGYRDNVEHALPVLRRHGAPWALFVTTAFADGGGRLWWIELEAAIAALDRVVLDGLALPAATPEAKQAAFEAVYWRLRTGPEARLRAEIARLADEAGIDRAALVRSLCLSWDDLRALSREPGVTIGAHTLTHPMLAKLDAAAAASEIADSGARIAAEIGRPVRHFSYPVGDAGSAGAREFALARAAGYATAVTTRPGHLFPEHRAHLHALPRVSVNGLHQTRAALRSLLSGVPFLAWNRGRRVNAA
jgi:peptidoglycan/xylan/chitin deacetylase (PgdA/CDA1 family)